MGRLKVTGLIVEKLAPMMQSGLHSAFTCISCKMIELRPFQASYAMHIFVCFEENESL